MTVQRVRSPRAADFVAGLKNGDLDHAKRARRLIVGISGRHRNRLWHWDFGGSARGFHRDTLGGVKSRRHDSSIRDRVVIPTTAPAGGRDARDRRRRGCDCDRFVQNNGEGHRPALRENRRRDRESSHEQLCCPGGLRRAEGTAPPRLVAAGVAPHRDPLAEHARRDRKRWSYRSASSGISTLILGPRRRGRAHCGRGAGPVVSTPAFIAGARSRRGIS